MDENGEPPAVYHGTRSGGLVGLRASREEPAREACELLLQAKRHDAEAQRLRWQAAHVLAGCDHDSIRRVVVRAGWSQEGLMLLVRHVAGRIGKDCGSF